MNDVNAKIIPTIIRWRPYTLGNNDNRIFYGNAIMFENSGTGNILINDVFTLEPGEVLALKCDPGEIDFTPYKISFIAGFVNKLQIWVKENVGASEFIAAQLPPATGKRPDRRKQNRDYEKRIKPNSDF